MKGALYYPVEEAVRNKAFIEALIEEGKQCGISLTLFHSNIPEDVTFIMQRGRNAKLAKQWEAQGYVVINRSEVNRIANDKLATYQLALLLGVSSVPTYAITTDSSIREYPVVVKSRDGFGGAEVFLCRTKDEVIHAIAQLKDKEIIAQPYIESNNEDVRVFMLGEEVLGAVKRRGKNSFKSNYTLGGEIEKYELTTTQIKIVQKISRALKSDYIGIDFLLTNNGQFLLNEIEDPVGARSLYTTTSINVAKHVVTYIQNKLTKKVEF